MAATKIYNFEKYQLSYLMIPKCGSTSITESLKGKSLDTAYSFRHNFKPTKNVVKHNIFTVIRNPADRAISAWAYLLRTGQTQIDDFADWLEDAVATGIKQGDAMPQSSFLNIGAEHNWKIANIFILEQDFWKKIQELTILEIIPKNLNKTDYKSFNKVFVHRKTTALLKKLYEEDFHLYKKYSK